VNSSADYNNGHDDADHQIGNSRSGCGYEHTGQDYANIRNHVVLGEDRLVELCDQLLSLSAKGKAFDSVISALRRFLI
jgi:hypothetical protein